MMIVVIMLMYTISFALRLPLCITIHNQCSNTELISPVYFGNGMVFSKPSGQQMDIGTKTKSHFEIRVTQDEFEGALLYELQRYSGWSHNDILTAKTVTKPKRIQMLMVWKKSDSVSFVHIVFLKNIRGFKWKENKLRKLYDKNYDRLERYDDTTSYEWLIDDKTVLETEFEIRDLQISFELDIFIYEKERNGYAMRPLWFDEKR
jgi:hypothetical protein